MLFASKPDLFDRGRTYATFSWTGTTPSRREMFTSSVRMGTTEADKFFKSQVSTGSRPQDFVGDAMISFFISSCVARWSSSRTQPSGAAGVADRSERAPPPSDAWISESSAQRSYQILLLTGLWIYSLVERSPYPGRTVCLLICRRFWSRCSFHAPCVSE